MPNGLDNKRSYISSRTGSFLLSLAALAQVTCSPIPAARPESLTTASPGESRVKPPVSFNAAARETPLQIVAIEKKPRERAAFPVIAILDIGAPLEAGEYAWNDDGVPDGETGIVVDLPAQMLYVYKAGHEIGRSSIIYGDDDKPTPLGTFPILEKRWHHVSNLYGAPMPFMLRLTWDGIAIHGSDVDARYATHGCVGIPDEFAALLFAEVKKGERVIITSGWANGATRQFL